MPSRTPWASAAPDGRLSRPTATRGGFPVRSRSQANVVYACPTARAAAGVSCSSTRPRMSYWRKIVAGRGTDGLSPLFFGGMGGLGARGAPSPAGLGGEDKGGGAAPQRKRGNTPAAAAG